MTIVLSANVATSVNGIELGKAAEYLVCSDLILSGYVAYPTDQGLPYDLVVDVDGKLLKVQVKGSCRARNVNSQGQCERMAYNFSIRRRGKGGSSRLSNDDCDLIACVALDIRRVAYFPVNIVPMTVYMGPPGYKFTGHITKRRGDTSSNIDEWPIQRALDLMRLK